MNELLADGWIDFDTFQGICFDVVYSEEVEEYNLHIVLLHYNDEVIDECFTVRTGIFKKSLEEMARVIQTILNLELFSYLDYWFEGTVFDMEANIIRGIDWEEEFNVMTFDETFSFPVTENRVLH